MRLSVVLSAVLLSISALSLPVALVHERRGLGSQVADSAKIALSRIIPEVRRALQQAVVHVEQDPNPLLTLTDEEAVALLGAGHHGDFKAIGAMESAVRKLYSGSGPNGPRLEELSAAGRTVLKKFTVLPNGGGWDITSEFEGNVVHQVATVGKLSAKNWINSAKGFISRPNSAETVVGTEALEEGVVYYGGGGLTLAHALNLQNAVGSSGYKFPARLTKEHMEQLKRFMTNNPSTVQNLIKDVQENVPGASVAQIHDLMEHGLGEQSAAALELHGRINGYRVLKRAHIV